MKSKTAMRGDYKVQILYMDRTNGQIRKIQCGQIRKIQCGQFRKIQCALNKQQNN